MNKPKEKVYGIADKAWQCVVGCDPRMSCAPRCWARKTVARIVECQTPQNPARAGFYQIALTPDGKQWSGKTYLDEAHLADPLKWRTPALIATGFHGDWARLDESSKDRVFAMMALCSWHQFIPLTKQPDDLLTYFKNPVDLRGRWWDALHDGRIFNEDPRRAVLGIKINGGVYPSRSAVAEGILNGWRSLVLPNVSIGCSAMNQPEADKMREPMAALAAMGWRTHVWYEPATGPVNWAGWEFLELIIGGGESGAKSRPSNPQWHRDTRDFCQANGIAYRFKQWGDWAPGEELTSRFQQHRCASGEIVYRVGKQAAGNLLDGILHVGMPEVRA